MARRLQGFVAGATHRELGVSFAEGLALAKALPLAALREFESSLAGQSVVMSTDSVSVLDTDAEGGGGGGGRLRSLHFNNRLDLVQSCARVAAGTADDDGVVVLHDQPPPRGPTGTNTVGLALALALHADPAPRVAVLGAGACVLPAFVHARLPRCTLEAVERSADVRRAARECFGIAELEAASDRFALRAGCAFEWLDGAADASWDVLVVDLEGGDGDVASAEALLAPPPRLLLRPAAEALARVLSSTGTLAVNALGGAAQVEEATAALASACGGLEWSSWAAPGGDEGAKQGAVQQRVLLGSRRCGATPTAAAMRAWDVKGYRRDCKAA